MISGSVAFTGSGLVVFIFYSVILPDLVTQQLLQTVNHVTLPFLSCHAHSVPSQNRTSSGLSPGSPWRFAQVLRSRAVRAEPALLSAPWVRYEPPRHFRMSLYTSALLWKIFCSVNSSRTRPVPEHWACSEPAASTTLKQFYFQLYLRLYVTPLKLLKRGSASSSGSKS